MSTTTRPGVRASKGTSNGRDRVPAGTGRRWAIIGAGCAAVVLAGVAWVTLSNGQDQEARAPLASPVPDVRLTPTESSVRAVEAGPGVTSYRFPDRSAPRTAAVAADGSIWVAEQSAGAIAHLVPSTGGGTLTTYGPLEVGAGPFSIAVDGDGVVWGTDYGLGRILRLDPSTGVLTRIPLPIAGSATLDLALTPTAVWFTDPVQGYIGRVSLPLRPGPAGVRQLPVDGASPYRMAAAQDGGAWLTDPGTDSLWRLDVDANPQRFRVPKGSEPYDIAVAPDGTVWLTLQSAGVVATLDEQGSLHPIALPGAVAPGSVAVDASGHVWVADADRRVLYEVDPLTRHVSVVPMPKEAAAPDGLTVAPDGTLWLVATDGDLLLHVDPERI